MAKSSERLIQRLPDYERQIRSLSGNNPNFDQLCEAFETESAALSKAESSTAPEESAEVDRIRRRRAALEQELIALMQQNIRV